jgi:hypothetical protein
LGYFEKKNKGKLRSRAGEHTLPIEGGRLLKLLGKF